MKIFTCIDHEGFWPVGAASVVVAADETEARDLLSVELRAHGLRGEKPFSLQEVRTDRPRAIILVDGEY